MIYSPLLNISAAVTTETLAGVLDSRSFLCTWEITVPVQPVCKLNSEVLASSSKLSYL